MLLLSCFPLLILISLISGQQFMLTTGPSITFKCLFRQMSVTLRSSHGQKVTWLWRQGLKHNTLGFATKLEQPLSINRACLPPTHSSLFCQKPAHNLLAIDMPEHLIISSFTSQVVGGVFPSGEMYLLRQYFFWLSF